MAEQNLILNILTFNHPIEQKDFAFYTEKRNGSLPINQYEFPINIEEIFPEVKTQMLQQQDTRILYPKHRRLSIPDKTGNISQ